MNVQQVIEELEKLPKHLPVRGVQGCVMYFPENSEPEEINPSEYEAQESTGVRFRGNDVLIVFDGMCA